MTRKSGKPTALAATAGSYADLLADIKQRIRTAQVRTAMAGNASLLALYWEIGSVLAKRQKEAGWGAAVLPRLATDLHNDFPEVKGFSARNLRLMIQFFDEYPGFGAIWQRLVAKLPTNADDGTIWQRAVAQLTWAHNIILIQKVKDLSTRLWYARQAFEHGWSRDVLSLQIQSRTHERQGKAVTNFQCTLPPPQSDLASQLLKDPLCLRLPHPGKTLPRTRTRNRADPSPPGLQGRRKNEEGRNRPESPYQGLCAADHPNDRHQPEHRAGGFGTLTVQSARRLWQSASALRR